MSKLDQSVHSCHGGAEGTRTPYLFHAMEALYQMSYRPVYVARHVDAILKVT